MVWNTAPLPSQERAMIGNDDFNHYFLFNPDEVKWNITNNTISRDTIGGRVVQLLSARVDQMTVIGRAGSREELQRMALNLKKIMSQQIQWQYPVHFRVPSRRWNFRVYIQNVSSLGWDYAATSYPYEITLLIEKDLTGVTDKVIEKDALERLAEGIGYSEELHGGNSEDALSTSEAYLNSIGYLRGDSRTATIGEEDEGDGGGGGGGSGGGVPFNGQVNNKGTEAVQQIYNYVFDKYNNVESWGIYVCKYIKGTTTYSQHSWANALDIGGNTRVLEVIAQDLLSKYRLSGATGVRGDFDPNSGSLPIAQILWKGKNLITGGPVSDHFDHVHVTGFPMYNGVPPCYQ